MVFYAGASAPLIFLISMVGMGATASSLAQFSSVYPSAGSFITYITRAIGTKVAVAVGVITVLGYIIAFGGIYIFVGIGTAGHGSRSKRPGRGPWPARDVYPVCSVTTCRSRPSAGRGDPSRAGL